MSPLRGWAPVLDISRGLRPWLKYAAPIGAFADNAFRVGTRHVIPCARRARPPPTRCRTLSGFAPRGEIHPGLPDAVGQPWAGLHKPFSVGEAPDARHRTLSRTGLDHSLRGGRAPLFSAHRLRSRRSRGRLSALLLFDPLSPPSRRPFDSAADRALAGARMVLEHLAAGS